MLNRQLLGDEIMVLSVKLYFIILIINGLIN
jgi:hypothetical protein